MHSFTDTAGREWRVEINVAQVKAARARLGIDIFKFPEDGFKPLGELLGDPCKMVDLLYLLCEQQADMAGVSDIDFGRSMGGDVLEQASAALVDETIDFFPGDRARQALRTVIDKGKELGRLLADRLETKLEALRQADAGAMADQLARNLFDQSLCEEPSSKSSAGSASASSESIRLVGPSASS